MSTKKYWIPLIRKDLGDTLTNEEIERILINIQRSAHISNSKKNGAVPFARIMLENNYEPVFVAGMLANIEKEANIGQLENSNYKTYPNEKPDYLKYMDTEYRDKNFYLNNYSNKKIMDAEMLILQKQILLN